MNAGFFWGAKIGPMLYYFERISSLFSLSVRWVLTGIGWYFSAITVLVSHFVSCVCVCMCTHTHIYTFTCTYIWLLLKGHGADLSTGRPWEKSLAKPPLHSEAEASVHCFSHLALFRAAARSLALTQIKLTVASFFSSHLEKGANMHLLSMKELGEKCAQDPLSLSRASLGFAV